MRRGYFLLLLVLLAGPPLAAGDAENRDLHALLSKNGPAEEQAAAVRKHFPAEQLTSGAARSAYLGNFVFAIESATEPFLYINDEAAPRMRSLPGNLWVHPARLLTGRAHAHFYRINGEVPGNRRFDTAAFTEDSYQKDGVPQGKLSGQLVLTSQVYRGWQVSYWVYASAGVDPAAPSPVMVWHDGHRLTERGRGTRLMEVVDNLVHQRKIPPMVLVFIAPGFIAENRGAPPAPDPNANRMRSILYDSVNDDYNKMVLGEIFPVVEKMYRLRQDGYSRATAGHSSGGICAFNQAWWRPDAFSRVLSRIGSFTALQWRRGQDNPDRRSGLDDPADILDGGNMYPFLVRRFDRKNIRVWLQDGSYDNESRAGSWPLQNIQLANSLKMKEYDFHFTFGNSQHNTEEGDAQLPEAMTWLWRDYDPSKTSQEFTMDPAEKDKPLYRVAIVNR
jgi:enterochelin esterase family protein